MPIDDDGGRYGASLAFSPNPPARASSSLARPSRAAGWAPCIASGGAASSSAACTAPSWAADAVRCLHHRVRRLGWRCDTGACRRRAFGMLRGALPWSCMRETRMCGWRKRAGTAIERALRLEPPQSSKTAGPWSRWAPPASTIARGVQVVRLNHTRWSAALASPPPSSRMPVLSPRPALPGAPLRSGRLRRVRRRRSLSPPLPPAADLTATCVTPCRRRTRSSQRQPSPCT